MPPISDLVRDSKLETKFYPGYTQHVYYVSGATPRQRKVRKEERWERGRNLGAGAFGIVWLEKFVTENTEVRHRAVKEIRKTVQKPKAADYSRELEAIAKFSHLKYELCFVKSFGWYENSESVFIAMEYFPLGDLQNYLSSPLPEGEAQQITSQILEGLAFMHENGFAHRDLKPNNILVKSKGPDWWIKIGDFGISKRAEEGLTALRTLNGTPGFLAPEMLMQLGLFDDDDFEVSDEYTVAVDIWSLGEIAFRALTGVSPFPIRSLRTYAKGASDFPVQLLQAHGISSEGCDFLKKLMAPIPQTRLSAKDALTHVWIEPQRPSSARASAEMQRSNSTRQEEITPDQLIIEASACWSTAGVPALEADIFMSPASKKHIAANPQTMQRTASNFPDTKHDRENPKPGEEAPRNGSASTHTNNQAQAKNSNQRELYTITEALARPGTSGGFVSPISSSHDYSSATTTTLGAPKNHAKPVDILPAMRAGESSRSESTSSSNEKHTAKHLPPSQISEASSHTFVSSRVDSRPSPISKRIQSMAIHTDNLSHSDRDEEHEACRTKERKIDQYETLCTADEDEERRRRPGWTPAGTPTTTVTSEKSFKSVPSIGALDGGHVLEAKMEPTNLLILSRQRNPHRAKLSQMTSQGRVAEVSSPSRSVTQESSFQEASHQAEKHSSEHDSSRSIREELLGPVKSDYTLGRTIRVHGLREDVWAEKKDGGERVIMTLRTKLTRGSYSDLLYEINWEVEILRKLHHPNLAHFYKMEELGKHFGIIFKNLPGGSLWDYIQERKSLREYEACEFFAHLISGVGYLQKVGVIHYLIRPKNLLLDEHCRLVIHNFILARTFYPNNLLPRKGNDNLTNGTMPEALVQESGYQFLQELMLERNGDSIYIAPEILGDSPYPAAKVDIWSCGLVLYEMLAGFIFRTGSTGIQGLTCGNITRDARPLFERLLVRDPEKRADVREIAGHAWLSQYASVLDFVTSGSTTARDIEQFFINHGNNAMPSVIASETPRVKEFQFSLQRPTVQKGALRRSFPMPILHPKFFLDSSKSKVALADYTASDKVDPSYHSDTDDEPQQLTHHGGGVILNPRRRGIIDYFRSRGKRRAEYG